ncbi:HK97-gp10 family putative phage morphogenesis protein [Mesorhizobium sp. ASY16-5R]|uniref:HK97-gp10 family putative phage morphogenesis protein n=1 Tax=Mesorhizobium sp. ASY16-5R TaxID=3445772 RepID=UPI003F9EBBF4
MTSILNLARLQRKLDRLPKVTKSLIRAGMEEQADTIVAMMKSLAPKDRGELADSIGWTWGKIPDGSSVVAEVKSSLGGDMTITIFAGDEVAYYAKWVEFGTQAHSLARNASVKRGKRQGEGRQHAGTPAQPFFFVSWRANKKGASRAVRAATRKAAKQAAAGS